MNNTNSTNTTATTNSSSPAHGLAPTYATPLAASAAYRSGLLKSDDDITGCHSSLRLAFRYVLVDARAEGEGEGEGDDNGSREADGSSGVGGEEDLLRLCWIRPDGAPCHFRPMRPAKMSHGGAAAAPTEGDGSNGGAVNGGHGRLRGSANSAENDESSMIEGSAREEGTEAGTMLVTARDQIETTYPGHAFVFCRRMHRDFDGGTATHENGSDEGGNANGDDPVVVHEGGRTYFRRRIGRGNPQNNSDDDPGEGKEEGGGWETYLVVGGYRPDPAPTSKNAEDEDSDAGEGRNGEPAGNESTVAEGGHLSDDDDDGRELRVQLVTITAVRRAPCPKMGDATLGDAEEDLDDDDVLPARLRGCSDCAESVPFLRGAMNPRTRHRPAFVATGGTAIGEGGGGTDGKNDGSSSNLQRPPEDTTPIDDDEVTMTVTACLAQLDPTPIDVSAKHYDAIVLGGWPCRAEPGCFGNDDPTNNNDTDSTNNPSNPLRDRFASDLAAAAHHLPPHARAQLQASTPVWINASHRYGPAAAPIRNRDGCFHPTASWLLKNGDNPSKRGGVEWYDAAHYCSDCRHWGPGGLMLHELSHAWHCLHTPDGYDNADVISTYRQAMAEGLYDCVRVHGPQGPTCKAYACSNQMEYFAELSVAFLGGLDDEVEHNKWYPFNRRQLREHDPRAFAMLCRIWGVEDDDDGGSLREEEEEEGDGSAGQRGGGGEGGGEGSKES
ncbi:hypothetical protein ACHAXT_013356 [Thalassiosira profunda]